MNSLDFYDFTVPADSQTSPSQSDARASSSSSTAAISADNPQPSLNEEVTQVFGQLGRLWGGVRKQSQTAFESARKDLGQVVSQAQKELEKLGQRPTVPQGDTASSEVVDEKVASQSDGVSEATSESSTAGSSSIPAHTDVPTSSSFFSRLQSSFPSNLTPTILSSTLQRHLPENLQHGLNLENATADFTQLRTTLTENIQSVQQGTTVQQAEKLAEQYMQKGEALFKEAGEFLKDAVKVVPPEEGSSSTTIAWDGTDIWTMPSPIQTDVGRGSSRKGKDKESNVLFSIPRPAKRADILLKKLRSNPELVREDPESDEDEAVKEMFSTFVKDEVEANGGIAGETWVRRISTAIEGHAEDGDAKALIALQDQLVPSELSIDVFWTHYFFRVYQIEVEEERRKALLAGANQDDDDFTWEDEEDSEIGDEPLSHSQEANETPINTSSFTVNVPPSESEPADTNSLTPTAPADASNSISQTPVCLSPRESEDSYDVVSSGNVSSAGGQGGEKKAKGGEKREGDDDGDESDWE
ncbi:hypothetical protein K439DRAFT_1381278 [Ramaria rubella]|nr:hypothetical protein K439DRAFT_1381278 [Ramaria rubella]